MDTEEYRPYDIPLEVSRKVQVPKWSFLISLVVGSILLVLFLLTKEPGLIVIGIYYLLLAIIANLIVLVRMVHFALRYKTYMSFILRHTAILLLNLPIALAYYLIVMGVI